MFVDSLTVAAVSEFFRPPPPPPSETAQLEHPPPRSRRPYDTPPGVVAIDVPLARSETTAIHIAYLDGYPTGFEFRVKAITSIPEHELRRDGEDHACDVFGSHWPMVGEKRDELPPQLLRVGVQFADGRKATNITGCDQPAAGPIMWPLSGSAGGGSFDQGYWVAPLPPPGPVAVVCEWPAAGIALARHELDAQLILDAADKSRPIYCPDGPVTRVRDGREWPIGTDAEIAWINAGTSAGKAITAAIPPVFASYCTLVLPENEADLARHEQAAIALLSQHTERQPWWLGYLDTGASDTVFPDAPVATVYHGWRYVLVEAGPEQAATWRDQGWNWRLPELMFPADRSWLLSTLWDDDWTCIGGPEELVSSFLRQTELGPRARPVSLGDDATPPGHAAR